MAPAETSYHSECKTVPALSTEFGWEFSLGRQLGSGTFGLVFHAVDESQRPVAIKCCPSGAGGIPHLLEASIMASLRHPNLNFAGKIVATPSRLNIIQHLAQSDLAKRVRKDKGGSLPDPETLRRWCHGLAQAVKCLHDAEIIHGDIKASNALVYSDGSVRLSDFTFSVRRWTTDLVFRHPVCTGTHRPPENFLGQPWSFPLDIWSLACTYYEAACGHLLFPNRDRGEGASQEKYLDTLGEWLKDTGQEVPGMQGIARQRAENKDSNYCRALPSDPQLSDLLRKMLRGKPEERLTISEVLEHPYFAGQKRFPCETLRPEPPEPRPRENEMIRKTLANYCRNATVMAISRGLYARCARLQMPQAEKAFGCLWIATKLVKRRHPSKVLPVAPHRVLAAEREICHHLSFRLHSVLE